MGPGEEVVYQARTNNAAETKTYIESQKKFDESNALMV
jgi:hypothetical protein